MTRIIAIVYLYKYSTWFIIFIIWVQNCSQDFFPLPRTVIRRSAYFSTCERLMSFKFSFTCRRRIDDPDYDASGLSSFVSRIKDLGFHFLTVTLSVFLSYFSRFFYLTSHQDKFQISKIRLVNDADSYHRRLNSNDILLWSLIRKTSYWLIHIEKEIAWIDTWSLYTEIFDILNKTKLLVA